MATFQLFSQSGRAKDLSAHRVKLLPTEVTYSLVETVKCLERQIVSAEIVYGKGRIITILQGVKVLKLPWKHTMYGRKVTWKMTLSARNTHNYWTELEEEFTKVDSDKARQDNSQTNTCLGGKRGY